MKNLRGDGDYQQADRLFGFEFSRKVQIQANPQFRERQALFLDHAPEKSARQAVVFLVAKRLPERRGSVRQQP